MLKILMWMNKFTLSVCCYKDGVPVQLVYFVSHSESAGQRPKWRYNPTGERKSCVPVLAKTGWKRRFEDSRFWWRLAHTVIASWILWIGSCWQTSYSSCSACAVLQPAVCTPNRPYLDPFRFLKCDMLLFSAENITMCFLSYKLGYSFTIIII